MVMINIKEAIGLKKEFNPNKIEELGKRAYEIGKKTYVG